MRCSLLAYLLQSEVSLSIAGGVLRDAPLNKLTPNNVRAVFAPKVDGVSNLLQSSWAAPLAAFNAFSSVASFIGSAGQGNYAAANSVLDAWAADAQAAGISGARPKFSNHVLLLWCLQEVLFQSSSKVR